MARDLLKEDNEELSTDINTITAEINAYQQVAGEAIFEIGRRLKYVKVNDLSHGEWAKWCEDEVNMTTRHANRFIRVYDRFSNRTPVSSLTISVLESLIPLSDEQIETEYELPDGTKKKPTEMSRRQIEEMKRIERERDEAKEQAEEERERRERLEEENEKLINRNDEVSEEEQEPYDRTMDEPYAVERGNDFYKMMKEVDELYKKYAHLADGVEELSGIAFYDDDLQVKYEKADEFWQMLRSIFNSSEDSDIIDVNTIN